MSDNFINAEFVIEEEDLDKNIRIINSFEQYAKEKNFKIESSDQSVNEKEIKDNCKISINDVEVPFSYFHKFNEKGKFKIRYSFSQNLKKINYIFSGCEQLRNIDFSHFNTKNVSDMSYMLDDCCLLENINLANFDTQNVTNMSYMFHRCLNLKNLDLSNFKTGNVLDMNHMFCDCCSVEDLDVSHFDTKNVTDMSYMFAKCKGLTKIDISKFNTENVSNMSGMFRGVNLANINMPNL